MDAWNVVAEQVLIARVWDDQDWPIAEGHWLHSAHVASNSKTPKNFSVVGTALHLFTFLKVGTVQALEGMNDQNLFQGSFSSAKAISLTLLVHFSLPSCQAPESSLDDLLSVGSTAA